MRRALWLGLCLTVLPLAWATTRSQSFIELSGANIDLRNGGAQAKANWLRYKLVEVNGPTGGYILAAGHGDQRGYLGSINALTGADALGQLLNSRNVTSCEQIPTFGELTGSLKQDGRTLEARVELGAGTRALPAHHRGAGKIYDKQLVLFQAGIAVLEVQLTCADAAGYTSGYFYRPAEDQNSRPHEAYFQQHISSGRSQVDFYMSHAGSGEQYAFRFVSDESGKVQIWNIRAMTKSRDSSGFAASYSPAQGIAQTGFLVGARDTTDDTSLASADLECISLMLNAGSSDCSGAGLAITNPGPTASLDGETHPFTVAGISKMKLRDDRPLRVRERRNDPADDDDAGPGGDVDYDDDGDAGS